MKLLSTIRAKIKEVSLVRFGRQRRVKVNSMVLTTSSKMKVMSHIGRKLSNCYLCDTIRLKTRRCLKYIKMHFRYLEQLRVRLALFQFVV